MSQCPYCATRNSRGVLRCRNCGADLPRQAPASRVIDIAAVQSERPVSDEQARPAPKLPSVPGNMGGALLGAGILIILAGRLLGQSVMGMGWLCTFIGLLMLLKGKSGKVRYGGAFVLSVILLSVLMPEQKEEPTPTPAGAAATTAALGPGSVAAEPSGADVGLTTEPASSPVPALASAEPPQPVRQRKSTGLSYSEVMNHLSNVFVMERSTPVDGLDRYTGQSEEGLAILEIIGDQDDIVQTTLLIALPNDSPATVATNSAILLRFLKNTFPGWRKADKWVATTIRKLSAAGEGDASTTRGNRALDVLVLAELGMISVTVRHKDDRR